MEYYATLGPSCVREDVIEKMIQNGMTGIRLNLSHGALSERVQWLDIAKTAAQKAGISLQILIDLEGPELRIGDLAEPLTLTEGTQISLARIPLPNTVSDVVEPGDKVLLDDGRILLIVEEANVARVISGGGLSGRKSLAVPGKTPVLPTLTEHDKRNLDTAVHLGITGVMLPFARGREDLLNLKKELTSRNLEHVRIFAKIENRQGVDHLADLAAGADEIVIARGDLGMNVPLWELPGLQKRIAAFCREQGKPFMVVTQMLDSMRESVVPTRAEVMDVYQAVMDGAASVMLTGETAVGNYPAEAVRYLVKVGREAIKDRNREE